jgi:hypothetical protein
VTWLPGEKVGRETRVKITSGGGKDAPYMPYDHWAYQGMFEPERRDSGAQVVASFGESDGALLLNYAISQTQDQVNIQLTWAGSEREYWNDPTLGDGIVFVHLYNQDNIHTEPVAQVVLRPGGGALPPGNWLPDVIVRDTYTPLPDDLPPGEYVVAIGMFDAQTGVRYPVSGEGMIDDRRLFIGEITIGE